MPQCGKAFLRAVMPGKPAEAAAYRAESITHRQIFNLAWPIILANASAPLLGLADTAVIGHTGSSAELGALAFGGLIFGFLYWGFGFLRMGTTGFTAKADGLGDEGEIRAALLRALIMGLGLGMAAIMLQMPMIAVALKLLSGGESVESATAIYFDYRIWGAPAALGTYALMGLFIGLGKSGYLLIAQLFLNGLNIALDILFAGVLDWGVAGVALGTAIAEWSAFALSLWLAWRLLSRRHLDDEPLLPWARLRKPGGWQQTLQANSDIMIRTLFMLAAFTFFINGAALFGDQVLAANHILLQLVSLSAFFLDGYANAAEPLIGRAAGNGRLRDFDIAARRSTHLAAATSVCLALLIFTLGPSAVNLLTGIAALQDIAGNYLPYCALYVLLSFAAFQLDGIFIGAGRTRDMRNMSLLSVTLFLVLAWPASQALGNAGLWLAFIGYVSLRAITLAACLPALRRSIASRQIPTRSPV